MRNKKKLALIFLSAAVLVSISQLIYLIPNSKSSQPKPAEEVVKGAAVDQDSFKAESLYLLINAHRKENKLSSLLIDPTLERSARTKIEDMLSNNYYRHADTTNQESWYLFKNAGYNYKLAGENISIKNDTPWQVFEGWVQSPTHNEQLLNKSYEDMGAAIDCHSLKNYEDGGCIVVLHLGLR